MNWSSPLDFWSRSSSADRSDWNARYAADPAGFRTHSLVCLASALLMLVTVYQLHWMTEVPLDTIRADPTRMAQGIMTGIGFLGAGVIFKEGLTVRGSDHRRVDLDHRRYRHFDRHWVLFSGHPWRGYYARGSCDFPSHRKQAAV